MPGPEDAERGNSSDTPEPVEGGSGELRGTLDREETVRREVDPSGAGCGPGRLKKRRGKLIYGINVSVRYCSKRAHFYAWLSDITTVLSLVGGSAVVADVLGNVPIAASIGATLVVVSSLCSLTFRWPEKARFWQDQRTKYAALEERFYRIGGAMTEEQVNNFKADVAALEADAMEGRTLNVLMTICDNEERSRRNIKERHTVWFWQRWFKQITDLPPTNWE